MLRKNNLTQYENAQKKAYEVLLTYTEGQFPINPFKVIKQLKDIKLITYRELAKNIQKKDFKDFSIQEIITTFPSGEGFLELTKKGYIMAYNDEIPPTRIRWTLFHELGHYFLKHLKHNNSILFSNVETYESTKEREANWFALQCSCPAPLILYMINYLEVTPTKEIMKAITGMSQQVNNYCLEHLRKHNQHYNIKKYKRLLEKFEDGTMFIKWAFESLKYKY